jgi:hypothetical protein
MPSTYTSSLRLVLPATGELTNTWGNVFNAGATSLIDASIAGTASITMTAADYTLSNNNGSADESRAMFLVLGGSPGGSYNVICPAVSKLYFVTNNTGFAQTVKTSAGTGISVPNGASMTLRCNGTDVVAALNYFGSLTLGSLSLTTPLSAANGGTGLSSAGSSGNVLTSNGTTWTSAAVPPGGLTYLYKTSNYTASDKEGILADTSGGAFTVTLPATPATGAQVVVADAGAVWGTNNLTVGRNGSTIGTLAEDLVCDINGASVQLVYDGTTWEVYAQVGGNGGNVVTLSGVQTLTNKTITFTDNTLTGVASTSTSQTLTNKTIEAGTLTNGYTEEVYALGTSGSIALNPVNGSIQTCALTGNPSFTDSLAAGQSIVLMLTNGSSYTVTWPTTTWVTSSGNTAPTLTAANTLVFWKVSTTLYGAVVGSYA